MSIIRFVLRWFLGTPLTVAGILLMLPGFVVAQLGWLIEEI